MSKNYGKPSWAEVREAIREEEKKSDLELCSKKEIIYRHLQDRFSPREENFTDNLGNSTPIVYYQLSDLQNFLVSCGVKGSERLYRELNISGIVEDGCKLVGRETFFRTLSKYRYLEGVAEYCMEKQLSS